jgi:hypothetical protein
MNDDTSRGPAHRPGAILPQVAADCPYPNPRLAYTRAAMLECYGLLQFNGRMRTFEYRVYPTRAQHQQLMACLIELRAIYNEMLADLKAQYATNGTFPTKYDLTARFKGRGGETVPATTVQMLADGLGKALAR